jgi:hypothetical protein
MKLDELKALERVDQFGVVPQRHLEVAWLYASCMYEVFDQSVMTDATWDRLTAHLFKFQNRLTPYFRHCVSIDCLKASTGSGIDWDRPESVPWMVRRGCEELLPQLGL